MDKTIRIKVLRPFLAPDGGKVRFVERDEVLDVPKLFGLEMIAAHKAEVAPPAAPTADAESAKTQDEQTAARGRRGRGEGG